MCLFANALLTELHVYKIHVFLYVAIVHFLLYNFYWGFPFGTTGKEPTYQSRKH